MSPSFSTNRALLTITFFVLLIIGAGIGIKIAHSQLLWREAETDLKVVYEALERCENRHGSLPVLAFYPTDPLAGEDSVRFALSRYVIDPSVFVSPGGHSLIRSTGLTYVWNTKYNGRRLGAFDPPQWVLMDIQGVDQAIPKAHRFGYAALFSDGTVRRLDESPFNPEDI